MSKDSGGLADPHDYLELWYGVLHLFASDCFTELKALHDGFFSDPFLVATGVAAGGRIVSLFGPPDKKVGRKALYRLERFYEHPSYTQEWRYIESPLEDLDRQGAQITNICSMLGLDPEIMTQLLMGLLLKLAEEGAESIPSMRSAALFEDNSSFFNPGNSASFREFA